MQRDIPDDLKRSEDLSLDAERALTHLGQRADTLQEELDRLRSYIDDVRTAVMMKRTVEEIGQGTDAKLPVLLAERAS